MACLVAAYKAMNGAGMNPRTELTLMIRPLPWSRMWGSTARVIRIEPKRLVSNKARACSTELSSAAPETPTPALLTSTSMRPDRCSTSRTAPATESSSVTSSGRNTTPPCCSPGAALRLVPYTVNPAPTSALAAASPIPAQAPGPDPGDPGPPRRPRAPLPDPGRRPRHKRPPTCPDSHERLLLSVLYYDHHIIVRT